MNYVHTRRGRAVLVVTLVAQLDCAPLHAPTDMTCRDSLGRFASCSSGGSGEGGLVALAIAGGLALVAGIIYLAVRPSSRAPVSAPSPVNETAAESNDCTLPIAAVQVCQSSRGYRFALPAGEPCAPGSQPLAVVRLTCGALERPAHHACLTASGVWTPLRSWESCGAFGLTNAPGDFVPPGRRPEQGVTP